MAARRRTFRATDGVEWGIDVSVPGASNAMVVFRHPGGGSSRLDRYAWYLWSGAEARNVTGRLTGAAVLEALDDLTLARLFRRSMPIQAGATPLVS